MSQKSTTRTVVYPCLLLVLSLWATTVFAGGAMRASALQGLDAQLGVRFLSPVKAGMAPGSQVDAQVTSPEKLQGLGLGSVKRGDRITLIKGAQGDDFSVKLSSQTVPMTLNPTGAVKSLIVQGGMVNTPAAPGRAADSLILQGGKTNAPTAKGINKGLVK